MNGEELWLYTLSKKNGVTITDIEIHLLSSFKNLLFDWNKKINLVSRKNEENIWKGHIALSLSMLFKIEFRSGMKILDLGTGGGFPGIPLSIMLPECSFVLMDSTQKKVTTVQSMVDSLDLSNVKTVWGRAEELHGKPHFHHSFDAIVVRSVSNLSNLLAWGLPFLKRWKGLARPLNESSLRPSFWREPFQRSSGEKISITTPSLIAFKGVEIEEEEKLALQQFPNIHLQNIPLVFPGSEEFENLEKKLVIVTE